MKTKYAVLVYQAGIANVFRVKSLNMSNFGREAYRLIQSDFRTCEAFALALAEAGVKVGSAWCNEAGDITTSKWNHHNLQDAPFFESMRPVYCGIAKPDSLTVQVGNETHYLF